MKKNRVVIASACRTALGGFGGSLSETPAAELGAAVIKEAICRAGLTRETVDHVYMGCVLQAGQGQNPARQAAIKAGLPVEVPALTVNVVCASGLESINMAARLIQTGGADVVVAGGMENMSMAPYLAEGARFGYRMNDTVLVDSMVRDALTDAFYGYHMIQTAENICENEKWRLKREELDEFAALSQQKCEAARLEKKFAEEIVPMEVQLKRKTFIFEEDEVPRNSVTKESLQRLKPINQGGKITAGNASGINDGAAAIVLISEKRANELGIIPMGYYVGGALKGVEPSIMGIGPSASTKALLEKYGYTMEDIDLVEANEAFAAQSLAVQRELGIAPEKLNVNGGAIALGHPVGASGCRILVTLLYEMKRRKMKRGLATLCVGGGMGCSTIVEQD